LKFDPKINSTIVQFKRRRKQQQQRTNEVEVHEEMPKDLPSKVK